MKLKYTKRSVGSLRADEKQYNKNYEVIEITKRARNDKERFLLKKLQ